MDNGRDPRKYGVSLMFQGTSSSVGKSVLATAFCRIFYQEGFKVAPFKAQNMASNSYITKNGEEMGTAQVVQSQAAGLEPDVRMNPIFLKPTGHTGSEVIIMGESQGNLSAMKYHGDYQKRTWPTVEKALYELLEENEILIIEGAGSPAEVNLKANDIVNMRVAKEINAPVILIADIDRGGALAAVVGTLELLDPDERELVKGIIFNKFRGDVKLLQPALDFIEEKTGIPVVGVVPYCQFNVPEEDSVALEEEVRGGKREFDPDKSLDIAIIMLPNMANFTDFDPLEEEEDVSLHYVNDNQDLGKPDCVIIPGSKDTLSDLQFLKNSGLASRILELWQRGVPIIGICGGYQMMGNVIRVPSALEPTQKEVPALGILPMETILEDKKRTLQCHGKVVTKEMFFAPSLEKEVQGYEIHRGHSIVEGEPLFELEASGERYTDGVIRDNAMGTYLHGLFDNDHLRISFLEWLWSSRGRERTVKSTKSQVAQREQSFNQLADLVRNNVDMAKIRSIMGLRKG